MRRSELVLILALDKPKTLKQIYNEDHKCLAVMSTISTARFSLLRKKLIKTKNPHQFRSKIYYLTAKGKRLRLLLLEVLKLSGSEL